MRNGYLCALATLSVAAAAGASVSFNGSPITENFDTLGFGTLAADGTVTPAPLSATAGTQAVIPGIAWEATRLSGTSTSALPYTVNSGQGNSGSIYNYGANFAATDRSLGSLASGSNVPAFGVEIVNDSAFTISEFSFSADALQFRSSTTVQNLLAFAYGVSGGGATGTNYLSTTTGMTALTTGDVVGQAAVASNGQLVPPASLGAITVTVSGLSVAPGQSIFLRWQDTNDGGNDAGLAINNFAFRAIPTPGAAALIALGGLVAIRRRRN